MCVMPSFILHILRGGGVVINRSRIATATALAVAGGGGGGGELGGF